MILLECGASGRCFALRAERSGVGLVPYKREIPQALPPRGHRRKVHEPGGGPSPEEDQAGTLTLDFPASRTVSSKISVVISYSVTEQLTVCYNWSNGLDTYICVSIKKNYINTTLKVQLRYESRGNQISEEPKVNREVKRSTQQLNNNNKAVDA